MRTRFAASGEGSRGGACTASQAATSLTWVSESRVATRLMQSGSSACRSPIRQRVSCAIT